MASILDKYGIKEVADVTFYALDKSGNRLAPVLYLDTLKVSTIEQTAEEATANGGKGNPPLIIWDYGKEINVTLEDALFSAKSMAIMFGGKDYTLKTSETIYKTIEWTASASGSAVDASAPTTFKDAKGKDKSGTSVVYYAANTTNSSSMTTGFEAGSKYFATFTVSTKDVQVIEISANSFPGNYYVTGDTYARSEANGEDEYFQFIIPKAKVTSENTITLEAEGDPSVFNMNLKVLRPADGIMMKLVKYDMN